MVMVKSLSSIRKKAKKCRAAGSRTPTAYNPERPSPPNTMAEPAIPNIGVEKRRSGQQPVLEPVIAIGLGLLRGSPPLKPLCVEKTELILVCRNGMKNWNNFFQVSLHIAWFRSKLRKLNKIKQELTLLLLFLVIPIWILGMLIWVSAPLGRESTWTH